MRMCTRSQFVLFLAGFTFSMPSWAVTLGGFGDVGWNYASQIKRHQFYQGALDLYMTSKVGDKASMLSEVVFESNEDGETVVDVERLLVQYHFSPMFVVAAGRFHTALGYWNDTFHHGNWLQTPVNRPRIYNFEDGDGILPVHAIGLEFRGETRLGVGSLGYVANIANGRGPKVDPPQVTADANNSKALNLMAYYTFPTLSNLRVGGTIYADTLPGGADGATQLPAGKETIWGAHLAWQPENFEVLAELLNVSHRYDTGEPNATVRGMYLQGFYQLTETVRPYVRYEYIGLPDGPDAYTGLNSAGRYYTAGVRYDLTSMSALKAEYERVQKVNTEDFGNNVYLNWSFAF